MTDFDEPPAPPAPVPPELRFVSAWAEGPMIGVAVVIGDVRIEAVAAPHVIASAVGRLADALARPRPQD